MCVCTDTYKLTHIGVLVLIVSVQRDSVRIQSVNNKVCIVWSLSRWGKVVNFSFRETKRVSLRKCLLFLNQFESCGNVLIILKSLKRLVK